MNARRCLLFSLGLNLALALALAWAARHPAARGAASAAGGPTSHRFVRVRPAGSVVAPTTVIEVQARFHWSEVESPDYQVYVANLRAIGCPERTIRDLIVADVNELFAGRVRGIVDPVQGRFWELVLREDQLDEVVEAKHKELQDLDEERERLFKTVLGSANPTSDLDEAEAKAEQLLERQRLLDFLSPDTLQSFTASEDRYNALVAAVYAEGDAITPAEKQARAARLAGIRQQEQAELKQLLTPGESEELELRRFGAGQNTRFAHDGVALTDEETRTLAALEFRRTFAGTDLPLKSPERRAAVAVAKQDLEARRRALLGEDRYAEWQRSNEPDYGLLTRVAERLNLPTETAVQAYDLREQALAQAEAVRANAALDAERKQALLQQLQAEAESALTSTLGARGFEAYRENGADWQQRFTLSRPAAGR
jgi:hypothetical protein